MMNQVEFAEFATALLQDHTVEVFHEEGLDDSYSLAEADDFTDTIFNLEMSAIDIFKEGKNLGTIWFAMDNSPSKGVYVEINNASDHEAISALVALADKYQEA